MIAPPTLLIQSANRGRGNLCAVTENSLQTPGPTIRSTSIFRTLRHAFADLLGTAALKLELLERTLSSGVPGEAQPLVERTRSIRGEIDSAAKLLDLLTRLDEVYGEPRGHVSIDELCRLANLPLVGTEDSTSVLFVRRQAASAALRAVASAASQNGGDAKQATVSLELADGQAFLTIEAPALAVRARSSRLLDLPRGEQAGEALFLALATAETDDGRLELVERDGHLVARFSWPTEPWGSGV